MSTKNRAIPLRWHIPDGIITRYANNILITHTDSEFIIMFFEVTPPLRLSNDDPMPEYLDSECVARIVLTPKKAQSFLMALSKNLGIYQDAFGILTDTAETEEEGQDDLINPD